MGTVALSDRLRGGDSLDESSFGPSTSRVTWHGFVGYRFPPEVIVLAVRWYLRFGLSYRDLEELLAERGIEVDTSPCTGGCSTSRR